MLYVCSPYDDILCPSTAIHIMDFCSQFCSPKLLEMKGRKYTISLKVTTKMQLPAFHLEAVRMWKVAMGIAGMPINSKGIFPGNPLTLAMIICNNTHGFLM